ncbi:hypothetical protein V1460_16065 [Streptomyces sp. SCSIO 30461]|uniref:hypothetical protein n=1 Tax=Streptomyces sp. SCSIO 30461 TaxID=3118085 RepID=UPI0030D47CDA
MTRFSDPTEGAVCLDGVPLPRLPLEFLRGSVTLLPQESLVLRGTIRENTGALAAARAPTRSGRLPSTPPRTSADGRLDPAVPHRESRR